jgi:hypothetical protein
MENKVKNIKAISIEPSVHEDFKKLQLIVSMKHERRVSAAELIKILVDSYKSKIA